MITFPHVRYCLEAPDWGTARDARVPIFLAPPRLRTAWPRLPALAATHRRVVIDAMRAGTDARSCLRFLLWLDTASCFAIETLEGAGSITETFRKHLPAAADKLAGDQGSVTAVIIARNEQDVLPEAIRSVQTLADELVVIDDESTDSTPQIAHEMGARILTRRLGSDFAAQKNAGIAAVTSDWVLCIDADERLEAGLEPLLRQVMRWPGADAVFVPVLNLITERGAAPVHWPDVQARLFRADLRYHGAVHERLVGWRRPLFTPLSGPYLRHEKSLARQHRSTLRYDEIDPTPYTREEIASVKEELARLEQGQQP